MRVSISTNRSSLEDGDEYFILRRSDFYKYVDIDDFECRNSQIIQHAYHHDWFDKAGSNIHSFLPPILWLDKGKIQFLNGRHRTALLLEFLTEIPVIFLSPDAKPRATPMEIEGNLALLSIIAKPLRLDRYFDFPDLPIKNFG